MIIDETDKKFKIIIIIINKVVACTTAGNKLRLHCQISQKLQFLND
jgi:hypothetical protein